MFKNRIYQSDCKWCFWRWVYVNQGTRPFDNVLTRLHIVKTPVGSIVMHWIPRPDIVSWLHDHPVSFLSIILRGYYVEKREKYNYKNIIARRWFNTFKASEFDRHRIIFCDPKTVTLCFMSRKKRVWGYHTSKGWIPYNRYTQ